MTVIFVFSFPWSGWVSARYRTPETDRHWSPTGVWRTVWGGTYHCETTPGNQTYW